MKGERGLAGLTFARAVVIAFAGVSSGCGGESTPPTAPVTAVVVAPVAQPSPAQAAPAAPAPVAPVTSSPPPSDAESDACLMAMMAGTGAPPPGCTLDRSDVPPVDLSAAAVADAGASAPAAPPRGNMTIEGKPSVFVNSFDRTLAGLRPRLRACYRTELAANPALPAGTVVVRLHIEPNGEVSQTSVVAPPKFSAGLSACVKRGVGNVQFDPPGGRGADAIIKGSFTPD